MGARRLILIGSATLAALPAGAAAQQRDTTRTDTTVYRIEGLPVQIVRPVSTTGGASAIEIDAESLNVPASPTTEEVFRQLPMLYVRTNSRGESEVTVRGSESRQVAVLVDGVPLTLGWDARTDVSVLPAGAVTDIRFVRGLSSMLHGPNVLGGVVEMSTTGRRHPRTRSLSVSGTVDSEGGYATSVQGEQPFSTPGGSGLTRFGVGWRDLPGFALPGGVSEPVPTDGLRLNTDATSLSGFFSARYRGDDSRWGTVSASAFQAERGIAAELGAAEPRLWRYPNVQRAIVALSGGTGYHATPWGRGDLEASAGVDIGRTEIESYSSRDYDDVVGTENGDDRTLTLRLLGDHTLGSRGDLAGAFTFASIGHEATVDGDAADYRQRLLSLAAETGWELLSSPRGRLDAVRLSVGGAWDRGWTPLIGGLPALGTIDDWGGRLGVSAIFNGGSSMVHAGASRRGRFPALREMYSEALNRFVPNPDLEPEQLVALEGGVTTRVGTGEMQVVAFHHDISGAIRRITLDDGRRMRVNADELVSTGLELLFSQSVGPVSFGGDLTLQRVALKDPTTSNSSHAENMPERIGRGWIAVPVVAGITGTAEAEYTGSQFCQDTDSGADVQLGSGTWLNAALTRIWSAGSRRIETSVSADNVG
ncbi:MAG: TonB-dependent receptor, partial [Gemmatimonadota bacterium]